jgi:hemerythrin-like domain-containing protein
MKPTQDLKKEHEAIKLLLKILRKISEKLESGEKVSVKHLDSILEFIRVFADKCHHGKEEGLLFPAMENAGIPRERGPIGVMLREHEEGRNFVKGMREAVTRFKKGDRKAEADIAKNARNYSALLSQHIDKEDNILYPMADERLSEDTQRELEKGFEKIEREAIGPGRHEEFHRILHHLKEVYLERT